MNADEWDESVWILNACHTEQDPVKAAEFVCSLQIFAVFSGGFCFSPDDMGVWQLLRSLDPQISEFDYFWAKLLW